MCGPKSGASVGSVSAFEYVFTARITTSTGPIFAGSLSTRQCTAMSPTASGALRILSPCANIASRCAPRATNATSWPAFDNNAP